MLTSALLLGLVVVTPHQSQKQTHDLKAGSMAPAFMVQTLDGDRVTLKELNPGGPVFLYFIHEGDTVNTSASSYIHRIVASYMPAKAKWYGVYDSSEANARSWLARYRTPYQMLMDRDLRMVHTFQVASSPTVIEIDPQGMIAEEWIGLSGAGMKDLNSAVAAANGVKAKTIDLTAAPSTTQFGTRYGATGSNGG